MNNIICEAVLSINNKVKLNVHWYLMVKDKIEEIYFIGVVKNKLHCNVMEELLLN